MIEEDSQYVTRLDQTIQIEHLGTWRVEFEACVGNFCSEDKKTWDFVIEDLCRTMTLTADFPFEVTNGIGFSGDAATSQFEEYEFNEHFTEDYGPQTEEFVAQGYGCPPLVYSMEPISDNIYITDNSLVFDP